MLKTYSYEEAYEASLEYFGGNELAAKVFVDKYALRNNDGDVLELNPSHMHRRIAREFARIEKDKFKEPLSEDEIYSYLDHFKKIIPQGSPMAGIGNPYQYMTLSNCYVLTQPVDSYGGILSTDEELVNISKRRGGVGISLDNLRPTNSKTQNAARTSTGILSWMNRYSNSINEVCQSGRRGALMLTLNVHHPDIETFLNAKVGDETKVNGANVSVQYTDEFLNAVENDEEYEQRWPINSKKPTISRMVSARKIWNLAVHNAWQSAEPGLQFWSNILKQDVANCYSRFGFNPVTSNPCVVGSTKILVKGKNGKPINKRIDKLVGKKIEVWNGWEWSETEVRITGTNEPVLKITTSTGKSIKCTYLHSFIMADGKQSRVAAKDLRIGDELQEGNSNTHSGYITKIEEGGVADIVYCFTEPKRSYGVFNNILTGQCSELILCILDSCRLLLLNAFSYVADPFLPSASFDYDEFYKDSQIAQRLMDDLIDLELECVDKILDKVENQDKEPIEIRQREIDLWKKIKEKCQLGRRTGTGLTAIGDTLAALGIQYGSERSINEVEKIYKVLKLGCYRASVDMAKELGTFPIWDHKLEKDNPFLLQIKEEDEQLWKDMKKYGRRNIALLTSAPAGSVSWLAYLSDEDFGTSSGIEPAFQQTFIKKKKGNPGDKDFRSDSVDPAGNHWMHFEVNHTGVGLWKKITGKKSLEESPYNGACAEEINWENRVRLQAAAQKHIDHSISSTVNLPENVSEEEVSKIYLTAWQSGCKGITVYRKGSRSGVLVDKQKHKTNGHATKRPKTVPCQVHQITVKGQPYFVLLGLVDDTPYEVFAGKNDNGLVDNKIKTGTVTKKARGKYHAEFDDGSELLPLTKFISDEEEAITRLCSTSLRHGVDINYIVHQLEKTSGDMSGFSKSVARALKKHIKDGERIAGASCPECQTELIRAEGCHNCPQCGYSKCS